MGMLKLQIVTVPMHVLKMAGIVSALKYNKDNPAAWLSNHFGAYLAALGTL